MNGWLAALAVMILGLGACGGGAPTATDPAAGAEGSAAGEELVGLVRLTPGECADQGVTSGSWFRMVQSGGDPATGPFVPNGDSGCGDTTWMPLLPGTDGGLRLGDYQPFPEPAFDEQGNGLADLVTQPTPWFAVTFALGTNAVDPQTGLEAQPPTVAHDGEGGITGDMRALSAAWNGQFFNQGSPKPDGALPGATQAVSGSYDVATGALVLEWSSQIVGGAFDSFTGIWHLEGMLEPAG